MKFKEKQICLNKDRRTSEFKMSRQGNAEALLLVDAFLRHTGLATVSEALEAALVRVWRANTACGGVWGRPPRRIALNRCSPAMVAALHGVNVCASVVWVC